MFLNRTRPLPSQIVAAQDLRNEPIIPGGSAPSMITEEERRALSYFAAKIWDFGCSKDAVIVDAGTFIGASTTALAHGLSQSSLTQAKKIGKIWSYDLFRATPHMVQPGQYLAQKGVVAGGSFRHVFDEETKSINRYLTVHEGNIFQSPTPENSISVLFLDILWSYDSTQNVCGRFYPLLEPRKSILVHQDFVYPYYPWVIIHMGMMKDCFRLAYNIPWSSMVFDVISKPKRVPDARSVSYDKVRSIYQDFIASAPDWGKGALWLGFAFYSASIAKFDEAFEAIRDVEGAYSNNPIVSQYFDSIIGYCKSAAESGNPEPLHGGA